MFKTWKHILDNATEFKVNIMANIVAGIISAPVLGIIAWVGRLVYNSMKESDKLVKLILIIAAAAVMFLAIILIIRKLFPTIRKLMIRQPASYVSNFDKIKFEAEISPAIGEIPDSWNEIIAAIDDGTAQRRYAVGAYKPLELGRFGTINMQLAGFNLDDRADGKGKAATTWIAKEILSETHRWNPYWDDDKEGTGAIGGWEKSELRRWMNERVLPAIPENVRDRLVSVKKSQESYDTNRDCIQQTTKDRVWIPSYNEVFGDQSLYYGLFRDQDDRRRVKTRGGSAAWWWLRSADVYDAYAVNGNGSGNYNTVGDSSGGVVVGFCL